MFNCSCLVCQIAQGSELEELHNFELPNSSSITSHFTICSSPRFHLPGPVVHRTGRLDLEGPCERLQIVRSCRHFLGGRPQESSSHT